MDAEERVADLIFISERLAEVLAKENVALRRRQVDDLGDLVREKQKLVRAYEIRMRGVKEDPALIREAEEDQREELRDLGERLAELMEENAAMLQTAVEGSRLLVDSVVKAVRDHQVGTSVYDETAVVHQETTRPGARGAALSLNDTV